jgi:hypothetical protein
LRFLGPQSLTGFFAEFPEIQHHPESFTQGVYQTLPVFYLQQQIKEILLKHN